MNFTLPTNTESYAIVIDFTENIKYKTALNSVYMNFLSHKISHLYMKLNFRMRFRSHQKNPH